MANKQERIATIIRKNIAEIIQFDLKDPHLGFVTIPEVRVSSDFSYAKVYVSFIKDEDIVPSMEVLEKSKGYIRSELASKLDTRRVPEISFVLDEGYKKEQRITELLKK
ncbi:MAG: 30S ribosome-binding factor RbfA [Bacilli bacterium]|nr:30S ribosome-binding factor RbfA [Bacilli bacterium]